MFYVLKVILKGYCGNSSVYCPFIHYQQLICFMSTFFKSPKPSKLTNFIHLLIESGFVTLQGSDYDKKINL